MIGVIEHEFKCKVKVSLLSPGLELRHWSGNILDRCLGVNSKLNVCLCVRVRVGVFFDLCECPIMPDRDYTIVFHDGHRVRLGDHSTVKPCRVLVKWQRYTLDPRVLTCRRGKGSTNFRSWLQKERQGRHGGSFQTKHARGLCLGASQTSHRCNDVTLHCLSVVPDVYILTWCWGFVRQ